MYSFVSVDLVIGFSEDPKIVKDRFWVVIVDSEFFSDKSRKNDQEILNRLFSSSISFHFFFYFRLTFDHSIENLFLKLQCLVGARGGGGQQRPGG